MPRTGGFALQETLNQIGAPIPIIFVSAHGDVRMSVRALQQGAVNFLEKPYDPQQMLDAVQETLELAAVRFAESAERKTVLERLKTLTPREREILVLVIDGLPSQNIARQGAQASRRLTCTGRGLSPRRVQKVFRRWSGMCSASGSTWRRTSRNH